MRSDLVVVPPPLLDPNLGIDAFPKPLQAQILVAEFAVERFVGRILPRLAGISQRGLDVGVREPAQNGGGDELWPIVRPQVPGCTAGGTRY